MERNLFSVIHSFLKSHRQNLSRSFNFLFFFLSYHFLIEIVEKTVDLFKQLVTSFVSKHNCLASHELTETGTETQSTCDQ